MRLFSNDLGVDLGTSNILIYSAGNGIVVNEPSVVALDKNTGRLLQVGAEAKNMLGRTPGNVVAMHPLKDGVISDHGMTVRMLQILFRRATPRSLLTPKPRVVICVPSGITEVEERTVINAAIEAGARRVYLVEEPLAAALGANLDISGPNGHMVVDIGGGTTDIAVLTMKGVACSSSLKIAGNSLDEAIARHIRRRHGVIIGQNTAEDIKIKIGCVYERPEDVAMRVTGRHVQNGMPVQLEIKASELYDVLGRPARQIADGVLALLDDTSPELVADIAANGITLTGGGSQLYGMAQMLQDRTGIRCTLADDAHSCVVLGCGKSISWINHMQEGLVNIAKKKILRGAGREGF